MKLKTNTKDHSNGSSSSSSSSSFNQNPRNSSRGARPLLCNWASMALKGPRLNPHFAAEEAVAAIGLGYDLCNDIRLKSCKKGPSGSRLIELDHTETRNLVIPGGVLVPHVSTSIKCDKGERTRFRSDVVSFHQVPSFVLFSKFRNSYCYCSIFDKKTLRKLCRLLLIKKKKIMQGVEICYRYAKKIIIIEFLLIKEHTCLL